VMGARQERAASDLMIATSECISAARKAERRTSVTPFRASWSGSPVNSWTVGAETALLQTEALRALRELCQHKWALHAPSGATELHSEVKASDIVTERADTKLALANFYAPPCAKTGAASSLRLAAQTAVHLGLNEGLRCAADAAALQCRIWDGQSSALLAQAWTLAPARLRTDSGAGVAEANIRLSSTGSGLERISKDSMAMPRTVAKRLSAQPGSRLRAAVSVVWRCQAWAHRSTAKAVLCWPQSTAAASEHVRQHWQKLSESAQQTRVAGLPDHQQITTTHDDAPACLLDVDADVESSSADVYTPDEGSGQAESDEMAAHPQQRCADAIFVCPCLGVMHAVIERTGGRHHSDSARDVWKAVSSWKDAPSWQRRMVSRC